MITASVAYRLATFAASPVLNAEMNSFRTLFTTAGSPEDVDPVLCEDGAQATSIHVNNAVNRILTEFMVPPFFEFILYRVMRVGDATQSSETHPSRYARRILSHSPAATTRTELTDRV